MRFFKKIFQRRFNVFMTLYVNFYFLPFKDACKFPILVFGRLALSCDAGEIIINSPIKTGMIYFGVNIAGFVTAGKSSLIMKKNSRVIFRGSVYISQGFQIFVGEDAVLDLDKDSRIGDNVKIICHKEITIGKRSEVTWESQVTDFRSHFIINMETKSIGNLYDPVKIGDFCWVGNRTTVMPGTILPDNVIVSTNSLLNRDYREICKENFSVIGGMPAKLLKTGMKRIYSIEDEKKLKLYFRQHNTSSIDYTLLPLTELQ